MVNVDYREIIINIGVDFNDFNRKYRDIIKKRRILDLNDLDIVKSTVTLYWKILRREI